MVLDNRLSDLELANLPDTSIRSAVRCFRSSVQYRDPCRIAFAGIRLLELRRQGPLLRTFV